MTEEVTKEDQNRLLLIVFLALIPIVWTMIASTTFFKAGIIYTVIGGLVYTIYKVE